jgi:hypothetical protein
MLEETGLTWESVKRLCRNLTAMTGVLVTPADYEAWLEGDAPGPDVPGIENFDIAVRRLFSEDEYEYFDSIARLNPALLIRLCILPDTPENWGLILPEGRHIIGLSNPTSH